MPVVVTFLVIFMLAIYLFCLRARAPVSMLGSAIAWRPATRWRRGALKPFLLCARLFSCSAVCVMSVWCVCMVWYGSTGTLLLRALKDEGSRKPRTKPARGTAAAKGTGTRRPAPAAPSSPPSASGPLGSPSLDRGTVGSGGDFMDEGAFQDPAQATFDPLHPVLDWDF